MNRDGFGGPVVLQLSNLLARPGAKQLVRYAIAGVCVTQFAAAVYSALVLFQHLDALLANVVSTGCGLPRAISRTAAGASPAAPSRLNMRRSAASS